MIIYVCIYIHTYIHIYTHTHTIRAHFPRGLNEWIAKLLMERGTDIFRTKGVLAAPGQEMSALMQAYSTIQYSTTQSYTVLYRLCKHDTMRCDTIQYYGRLYFALYYTILYCILHIT